MGPRPAQTPPYCEQKECFRPDSSCIDKDSCRDCCTPRSPDNQQPPPDPPSPPAVVYGPPLSFEHHKSFKLPIVVTYLVVILATAFFFFTCYVIYRFISYRLASRRRRRSGRREPDGDDGPVEFLAEEHGPPEVDHPIWYIRTVGLDPSVIGAITVVKYKSGDGLIDGTDCSICLSEFQDDETLRLLPKCSHAFHIPCIDTWLRSHTNCPMCRARIVVDPTAMVPAPTAEVQNPGLVGEINQETAIDSETSDDDASGAQSRAEIAVKIDNECGLDNDGVQPVRRSVSMDSMSAAMISAAVADAIQDRRNNEKQLIGTGRVKERSLLRFIGSPSIERAMQSGPSAVKRSLSCSAKVFLQRHSSRSRGSILPQ